MTKSIVFNILTTTTCYFRAILFFIMVFSYASLQNNQQSSGWSAWSDWECPVTCGGGQGKRTRTCSHPGLCQGPKEEFGLCNEQLCPDILQTLSPGTKYYADASLRSIYRSYKKEQGDSVTLPCNDNSFYAISTEYPASKISWVKNGNELKVDGAKLKMEQSALRISKLDSHDSGVYVCRVKYAARSFQAVSFSALAVKSNTTDTVVTYGESLNLACNSATLGRIFPKLNQKWYINGTLYRDFPDSSPLTNNAIVIDEVKYEMSGVWECEVSHPENDAKWSTNIIVVNVLPPVTAFDKLANHKLPLFACSIGMFLVLLGACFYINMSKNEEMKLIEKEIQVFQECGKKTAPIEPIKQPENVDPIQGIEESQNLLVPSTISSKTENQHSGRLPSPTFISHLDKILKVPPPATAFTSNEYVLRAQFQKLKSNLE